jgi:hypothetical protein
MESSMGRGALAYALCQAFSKAHPSSDVANYNVYRTIASNCSCVLRLGIFRQPNLKLPEI